MNPERINPQSLFLICPSISSVRACGSKEFFFLSLRSRDITKKSLLPQALNSELFSPETI